MNGLIDDPTIDGWMALAISILRGVPPDQAFKMLDNPKHKYIKWTPEMFEEVEKMREQGMTWREISDMYQVERTVVLKAYNRFKGKEKRSYQYHGEEFYKKIDAMRKQGVKWKDISKQMGMSESRLCSLYSLWKKRNE